MKKLWWRFLRLLRESEIRLSAAEVRFEAVRPGDRLQIGPRLWRVEQSLTAQASLELAAAQGPPRRVRLRFVGADAVCPWVLESRGTRTPVAPRDLLHFPLRSGGA